MTSVKRLRSANNILRSKGLSSIFLLGFNTLDDSLINADVIPEAPRASIDDLFPGEAIEIERVTLPYCCDFDNPSDGIFDAPDTTYYLGLSTEGQADRFLSAWNSEPLRHLCNPDDLFLITYFDAPPDGAAAAQQTG